MTKAQGQEGAGIQVAFGGDGDIVLSPTVADRGWCEHEPREDWGKKHDRGFTSPLLQLSGGFSALERPGFLTVPWPLDPTQTQRFKATGPGAGAASIKPRVLPSRFLEEACIRQNGSGGKPPHQTSPVTSGVR